MSATGTPGTNTKSRAKRQLADHARRLAVEGKWAEALAANQELLERTPKDVEAYNRIGKANFELGRYRSAYAAYQEAVRFDPANVIARRNIERIEPLKDQESEDGEITEGDPIRYGVFIEEVGKTYVDDLVNCAVSSTLNLVSSGDRLDIRVEAQAVQFFSPEGDYVGELEPRVARRVIELLGLGNVYEAFVTSSTSQNVRVIIREVSRGAQMAPDRLSFPRQGKVAIPRAYLRDTRLFRGDEPALLLTDEDDDEVEGDDAEDFEATDLEDEAEYAEDAGAPAGEEEEGETL